MALEARVVVALEALMAQAPVVEMEPLEQQILEAVVAVPGVEMVLTLLQAQVVALELLLSNINQPFKKVLAVRLHPLVAITTTHSHLQALTQHKGKTHVTFCKSSRRHRYTSYRC
jgi:hypothetical protein